MISRSNFVNKFRQKTGKFKSESKSWVLGLQKFCLKIFQSSTLVVGKSKNFKPARANLVCWEEQFLENY